MPPGNQQQSTPGESKILIYGDTGQVSAKVKNTGLEVEARWTPTSSIEKCRAKKQHTGRAKSQWVAASFIIATGFHTYMRKIREITDKGENSLRGENRTPGPNARAPLSY